MTAPGPPRPGGPDLRANRAWLTGSRPTGHRSAPVPVTAPRGPWRRAPAPDRRPTSLSGRPRPPPVTPPPATVSAMTPRPSSTPGARAIPRPRPRKSRSPARTRRKNRAFAPQIRRILLARPVL